MTRPTVFVSSSRRDAPLVAKLESALERLGLDILNPVRDLRAGEDFRKTIQAGLKRADALVMLVGAPQRAVSSWMSYEAGVAEALGKEVMVLLPDKYPVGELPADFAASHVLAFDAEHPERAARDIAERLALAH